MASTSRAHAAFGRRPKQVAVDPDAVINWGCSLKGWNCCVDKGIVVRPYDMVRLRHVGHTSSQQLTADKTVTFAWHGPTGALVGSLAHRPYGTGHVTCHYYEEITNRSAARIRDEEPQRFASLPPIVQRAANAPVTSEYRVAGLCAAHLNRPEVCRAFPYQRQANVAADGATEELGMLRVNVCGSCALSTPTTPRAIAEGEDLAEYWRANDAFSTVMAYYRARGAARVSGGGYRALPLAENDFTQLWAAMYLPDADPAIVERFGEQYRADLDVTGDREVYRMLMTHALDRLDALCEERGYEAQRYGTPGETPVRPDLDALLDPARVVLPGRRELEFVAP